MSPWRVRIGSAEGKIKGIGVWRVAEIGARSAKTEVGDGLTKKTKRYQ
jgi:hypothetical protein